MFLPLRLLARKNRLENHKIAKQAAGRWWFQLGLFLTIENLVVVCLLTLRAIAGSKQAKS